jgi:hypothetical protein
VKYGKYHKTLSLHNVVVKKNIMLSLQKNVMLSLKKNIMLSLQKNVMLSLQKNVMLSLQKNVIVDGFPPVNMLLISLTLKLK